MSGVCVAVPGKVVLRHERGGTAMAQVDFGGVRKEVCAEYVPEVQVGEWVTVHLGFALERMDEDAALEMLATLARLGLLHDGPDDRPTDGAAAALPSVAETGGRPSC